MNSSMVSARMTPAKKEAGNRILESLGTNASRAVNELFDYVIANKALPWQQDEKRASVTRDQILEGISWVESLRVDLPDEFASMTTKDAKRARLAEEGLVGKALS